MHHILHTGQTRCYDQNGQEIDCQNSGHDAEAGSGVPWPEVRFEVQGETVLDHATGLYWTQNANPGEFPCTWMEAFSHICGLNQHQYGGYNDWRLPNRNELRSLVSYQTKKPALPEQHPFQNFFLGWYWSSTTAVIQPAYAWAVHLEGARMFYGRKDQGYLFWPVRGKGNGILPLTGQHRCFAEDGKIIDCAGTGQDGETKMGSLWPNPRFTVIDEVVYDRLTHLFWLKHADITGRAVDWQRALECIAQWNRKTKTVHFHWRLPTINELASLVDCDASAPALPADHPFTGIQTGYWSSTTSYFETDWAWVLYLDKGACGVGHKPGKTFHVWPVSCSPV
ncbi:MAG: DUF1566 domain-containing protein [Desulfobulbus sp.]|nr:DUF1566 domain-containing protein [Desulfobulbus sp.]